MNSMKGHNTDIRGNNTQYFSAPDMDFKGNKDKWENNSIKLHTYQQSEKKQSVIQIRMQKQH